MHLLTLLVGLSQRVGGTAIQWIGRCHRAFHSQPSQATMLMSRKDLRNARRIVVKLGSAVVTHPNGGGLALGRVSAIVEQISELYKNDKGCVLVTSGAMALGRHHLDTHQTKCSRGARAALGMAEISTFYGRLFEACGFRTACFLLTPNEFSYGRIAYWQTALHDLMSRQIVPVINTNDAVNWTNEAMAATNGEPMVIDNDTLAARLAKELSSDLLILASNVDGVYTTPPGTYESKLIDVYRVNSAPDANGNGLHNVEFGEKSDVGTGGMESKVASAEWATRQGTPVVICHGDRPNFISDIVAGKGVGTFFTLVNGGNSVNNARTTSKETATKVREASLSLPSKGFEARVMAIEHIAESLVSKQTEILKENEKDMTKAKASNLQHALIARLKLDSDKLNTLSQGLKQIASQCRASNGHIGKVLQRTLIAQDCVLEKITVPIGVLLVIFESRPDCLPQIAALSIASGNGLLAKPGKEALHTVRYLHQLVGDGLEAAGLSRDSVGLLESRKDVEYVLGAKQGHHQALVDMVIPRGSGSMIKSIRDEVARSASGVPVLGHGAGVCHVYVDQMAEVEKAINIVIDSKCDYPAACNSMETLLVHESHVRSGLLRQLCDKLNENSVQLFAGPNLTDCLKDIGVEMESTDDLSQEFSDLKCTVEVVRNTDEAIKHIAEYGSGHTESIVSEDKIEAEKFLRELNSACVFHNVSTRFSDGFRFGLGAEVGINTARLYTRGPVGVDGLLITKWILRGNGEVVSDFSNGKKSYLHESLPAI